MNHHPFPSLLRMAGLFGVLLAGVRADPPSPGYELLFADEFDGPGIRTSDWEYRVGPRTGAGIDGLNLARNVRVADGHLIIAARLETVDGRPANTGGGLISRHRFGYGYYEVRSRPFMEGRGVHTAFWQRGLGGPENNSVFEIDSHEIDSTQRIACNNLYVDVSTRGYLELAWPHRAHVPLRLPADGWWVDAYEYTPDGVVFFDHGVEVARADFPDLTAAQNVWLTALNGVGRVDAERLPGETRFDYFRYYARDYPGANLLGNGGFEYNQDKVDLQRPVCWSEEGDVMAGQVVRGGAAQGDFRLRHAASGHHRVATLQSLAFIRNGTYELRAKVRRGGSGEAFVAVSGHGGEPVRLDLPVSPGWTGVLVPRIEVASHAVTVRIESAGGADDWLEVDEIQFLKPPLPGQQPRPSRSFAYQPGSPLWEIARHRPIAFSGDEAFYFFGRNVGQGEAITVACTLRADAPADTFPVSRLPKAGAGGWAVGLGADGSVFFRVGTQASHRDVVAPSGYRAGEPVRVVCVYDHGSVRIHLDGRLRARADGVTPAPLDTATPGRLGANSGLYDAVGDVTLLASGPRRPATRFRNFAGSIGGVRIYNRALSGSEIEAHSTP